MIGIKKYNRDFEELYWEVVNNKIPEVTQKDICESYKKYLPQSIFPERVDLKELVLAPYSQLKAAYLKIDKSVMIQEYYQNNTQTFKPLYQCLHDVYKNVVTSFYKKMQMNVRLVKESGLMVCPYCNRDYINNRGDNVSGAQLDHFYPRSEYPIFSVCLYNLVPVCGNCNRTKSKKEQGFVSPFDEEINWENEVSFSYDSTKPEGEKIIIKSGVLEENIIGMKIREAYQIHDVEAQELLEKVEAYSASQLAEFDKVLGKERMTEKEMIEMIFGKEITKEQMMRKPLAKMMHDLAKEWEIYKAN